MLECEAINTAYGDSHILHDVSLSVDEGEIVALLGRNGVGKTTTLRSIIGSQPPFDGSIRFEGEEIVGKPKHKIANLGIGYVPEERRIFPNISVEENLVVSLNNPTTSRADELERIYDIFPTLAEMKGRKGKHLSGGEQQMLAIGRALTGRTKLLMLDEPSEGLAPQIVESIKETLLELRSETTILLVEQNYPLAQRLADRYYILDKGEIVSEGTIAELDADEDLKDEYLGVT